MTQSNGTRTGRRSLEKVQPMERNGHRKLFQNPFVPGKTVHRLFFTNKKKEARANHNRIYQKAEKQKNIINSFYFSVC